MFAIGVQHETLTVHLPLYPLTHIHTACMRDDEDIAKKIFYVWARVKNRPAHVQIRPIDLQSCSVNRQTQNLSHKG
jgi:hypothetical protein